MSLQVFPSPQQLIEVATRSTGTLVLLLQPSGFVPEQVTIQPLRHDLLK